VVKNELGLELAARKCPTCKGEKEVFDPGIVTSIASISPGVLPCPTCRGSGFWLQGVREKCGNRECINGQVYPMRFGEPYSPSELAAMQGEDCKYCGGTGYTVSLDVGKWLEAAFKALDVVSFRQVLEGLWDGLYEGKPPLEALQRALMEVKP